MASKKMVDLPGSTKVPYRDARAVAPAASDERLEVTLRVRPKTALPEQNMLKLSSAPVQQLTHDEYEETYGATAKDLASIGKFAKEYNLNPVQQSAARRTVILAGTVKD